MAPASRQSAAVAAIDAFADAVGAIGSNDFDEALLAAINRLVPADDLTILTCGPSQQLRPLVMASNIHLSSVRSLMRDFISREHVRDPNFRALYEARASRRIIARQQDIHSMEDPRYLYRFFTSIGTIDKFIYIWNRENTVYYVNLYRSRASGRFNKQDQQTLEGLSRMIANLTIAHCGRTLANDHLERDGDLRAVAQIVPMLNPRLTSREIQVLTRIIEGMTTEGIAIDLGVKPTSVITFRKRGYRKLGLTSQRELYKVYASALSNIVADLAGRKVV